MSLLGLLFWSEREDFASWLLAATHGFVMTSTRIVGLPLAFTPFLLFALKLTQQLVVKDAGQKKELKLSKGLELAFLGAIACMGGFLFFVYCDWRFGQWDLYMQTQRSGWGIKPDYLAVFEPNIYRVFLPKEGVDGFVDPHDLSRLAVPLTAGLFGLLLLREIGIALFRPDEAWCQRAVLYFGAVCLFYICVCGLVAVKMDSMIRYSFVIHVFLVTAVVHQLSRRPLMGFSRDLGFGLWLVAVVDSFWLQSLLVYHFCHAHWVA